MHNNIAARQLKTALSVALARAEVARQQWERLEKARRAEERRAAFTSRLDASTWHVWRRGAVWYAEHAGTDNFFAFHEHVGGRVEVISGSGKTWWLDQDGRCNCPCRQRPCKHEVAAARCREEAVREQLRLVAMPAKKAA